MRAATDSGGQRGPASYVSFVLPPETWHRLIIADARDPAAAPAEADLVLTSPPYPMIQMWDDLFGTLSPAARRTLENGDGPAAFEYMHTELDHVWSLAFDRLRVGGFLVINIGDATRTIAKSFRLYPNHARIVQACADIGFETLPGILWRKQTNAPNKFMGSGMLPAGAYVTLEHEHILIFRKGGRRTFPSSEEKKRRRSSSMFWEERNAWYSDIWFDIKGTRQATAADADAGLRKRSAAFPFELAYRLISMFSLQGDTVWDPFVGTGTTMHAAAAAARHSAGTELDENLAEKVMEGMLRAPATAEHINEERLLQHARFVEARAEQNRPLRYVNTNYLCPVMTRQELELCLPDVKDVERSGEFAFRAEHHPFRGTAGAVTAIRNGNALPLRTVEQTTPCNVPSGASTKQVHWTDSGSAGNPSNRPGPTKSRSGSRR